MKNFIKFILSKFSTSKYIIKGKCRQCGACCKNIVFLIKDEYITTEEQFEKMKEWDRKYEHFFVSGKKEDNSALLFTCKSLDTNNKCKDYKLRSLYCRRYPYLDKKIILGGFETFDECGYSIEVDKKFNEFLDS